jgi:tRNA threonylcarbamoyladenosine biosynthesis protein TsaB
VIGAELVAVRQHTADRGQAAALPVLAAEVLGDRHPTLVAVVVGPGSFTGLRASLALAHGVALGAACPVVGVTVGEALAEALPHLGGRALWVAIDSRRDRLFLERNGEVTALAPADLPMPDSGVALAGDAARVAASWLAARDADVMLTNAQRPSPRHIALAAARRLAGNLPPRQVLPLYVDPPETRAPAASPRPAPA